MTDTEPETESLPAVADRHAKPNPRKTDVDRRTVSEIATAIANVTLEVGVVSKHGFNQFHQYSYAAMQDVLQKLTPLLSKNGLVIIQTELKRSMFDDDRMVAIEYEFTIAHRSGEVWPDRPKQTGLCRCRDSKGGFDDKSFNKCHTAARKYFLLALFQIATGEEDDADRDHNTGGEHFDDAEPARGNGHASTVAAPTCPKCKGPMWDNTARLKEGKKGPQYSCKAGKWNKETRRTDGCDGLYWEGDWPPAQPSAPAFPTYPSDEIPDWFGALEEIANGSDVAKLRDQADALPARWIDADATGKPWCAWLFGRTYYQLLFTTTTAAEVADVLKAGAAQTAKFQGIMPQGGAWSKLLGAYAGRRTRELGGTQP